MSGYSKDAVRQNKALQDILEGGTPDSRIFVANADPKFKKKLKAEKDADRKRIEEKFEATKGARMPWFCPKCDKIMKKRLDNKMWILHNNCFDCQLKIENKMRIDGTYNEWEKKKVQANIISWIKEQKESILEFKKQKTPEFYQQFRPDGYSVDKEKWSLNEDKIIEQADEALEHLQKMEDSLK